jgi:hypothetical protein
MAAKRTATRGRPVKDTDDGAGGSPVYPYTPRPGALRKLLQTIPTKGKPAKITIRVLQTWGVLTGNDASPLAVAKKIGLVDPSGVPTPEYEQYMGENGGDALGKLVRATYPKFFESYATPNDATEEETRRFFRINGGGSDATQRRQVETFRILNEFATFGGADPLGGEGSEGGGGPASKAGKASVGAAGAGARGGTAGPDVRIDLHIRLPENKSKADYDSIIESIANHIYGRRTST